MGKVLKLASASLVDPWVVLQFLVVNPHAGSAASSILQLSSRTLMQGVVPVYRETR